jgi:hypothetical protein
MEKITLPTKTKIAAWWMIVVLPLVLIGSFYYGTEGGSTPAAGPFLGLIFIFTIVSSFIFSLAGIFVLLRKKWAWGGSFLFLLIYLILWLIALVDEFGGLSWCLEQGYSMFYRSCRDFTVIFAMNVFLLIPFILFLLDRKNYWKIAS